MINVLVPTDFSAASLRLAEQAITSLDLTEANIILFHAFTIPDSEVELFFPGKKPYADLLTDSFRQSCKLFRSQYPDAIKTISFRFMDGSTPALFRNFAEANEVDLIVCPDDYCFVPVHKQSVDPRLLFKKSGIRVLREFETVRQSSEEKELSASKLVLVTSA